MNEPTIDVVVVTYNSQDHLASCLDALPRDVNVFVVDNASEDNSAVLAELLGASLTKNEANLGFGAAANQGARAGRAPFVLFLNPDAVVGPGCVETLREVLECDPQLGIVGPRLVRPDGSPQRATWPFPSAWRSWAEAMGVERFLPRVDGFVVGACLLVRRAAFEEVGGFDERYWLYGEEADLAFRIAQRGFASRLVPQTACRHIGGASGGGTDRAFEEFQRGTERFLLLQRGQGALLSYRLALLVGSLLRLGAMVVLGRGRSPAATHRWRIVRRLARLLLRSPMSVPMAQPAAKSAVVLSLEPWDEIWRRNQFLVRELLRQDVSTRVLYVEPPRDLIHEILHLGRIPGSIQRRGGQDPRLVMVTPHKWWPRMLGPWADQSLLRQLRRNIERHGFGEAVVWVNDPSYAGVVRWRHPVLYDLTDDWTKANRPRREHRRLGRWDRALTARADVITACSVDLVRSHSGDRPVHLLPNAVDVDDYVTPRPRPPDLPSGTTALYVGTLHEDRLDVDLVTGVARMSPEISLTFVGPDALSPLNRARLDEVPNVHLLGPRPQREVPAYLQHADVLIVPHIITPFTESLDPIKAYEYRVIGKPIVSTPVAGFRDAPWATVTASAAAFAEALRDVAGHEAVPDRDVPTWTDRGRDFADALWSATKRPLVVYLDHVARLSGGELALLRLLPELDVRAHVILAEDGPLVERLRAVGATVEVVPLATRTRDLRRSRVTGLVPVSAAFDTIRYVITLTRRLRDLRPDLVHTNSLKSAYFGTLAAHAAAVPVLVHVRDRIAADYLPAPAVWMTRLLVRLLATATVANSQATLDTLHLSRGSGAVVGSPVVYDSVESIRVRSPRRRPEFVAMMVGRIAPWKGQDVFLRAFAEAFPEGDERAIIVGGVLFGEHEYERLLVDLAAELALASRVEFTGHRNDVPTLLAEADVLIHASTVPEPFGQVIIEGMAAGVPVIASNAGGPAEIILDGSNGLLVPPGDVAALADAMRRVRREPDLAEALRTSGLQRAEDFRPSTIGQQMALIYQSVLER